MELKKVREIMIPLSKYPHIPYWFSLRQAVAEMEKSEIEVDGRKSLPRSVLVFDEKYRLLGVVRRRDILKKLEPGILETQPNGHLENESLEQDGSPSIQMNSSQWIDEMQEKAERPVSDIMLPINSTVDSEDQMIMAIYEMIDNDLSIIPVMKDNKVAGVVRSVDVFHEIAKLLL